MKTVLKCAFALLFLATLSASAQLMTWVQGTAGEVNRTNVLSTNQVMEFLTMTADNSTVVEVTVGDQMVSFGSGGILQPTPFVIAGPATVVFRRTSSGGTGSIITYRISQPTGVRAAP